MPENTRAKVICEKPHSHVFSGSDKLLKLQTVTLYHTTPPIIEDDSLFVYVCKGKGKAVVNGVEFALEPGVMGWLNYYQVFTLEPLLGEILEIKICVYDYQLSSYLVFSPRELDRTSALVRAKPFLKLGSRALKHMRMSLNELESLMGCEDPGSTLIKVATLGMMDTIFCQETLRQHNWPVECAPLVWNVTLYNFSQCTYKINVDTAANYFLTTPAEINHAMKMSLGMNFNQMLVRSKMHRAISAILFDGLSFNVLASRAGFSSEIVFFRTFKKFTGMTPQEYRSSITEGNHDIYRSLVTNEAFLSILHYIFTNYTEQISLMDMKKELFLSQNVICKMIMDNLGISYKDLIDLFRVNYAQSLLVTTSLPVVDVSVAVGFNSTRTFMRVFKHYNRMSPSVYRNKYNKVDAS